ncbi:hypothetical protein LPN04_31070 [Rugamonas sp. A1-17]|nr:hypothetical protein [Rugamonas sp. A1-17]
MNMVPVNEEIVQSAAKALGENSIAAKALADAQRRRAAGEVVSFFWLDQSILVFGEKPSTP